jgi:dTDP-4-amino-4,6-dideoxygalactose transaminase
MKEQNNGVPFLDLVTPHLELEGELTSVFHRALASAGFIGGPMVTDFEEAFAQFCGTAFCVGVGSGTDALRFALVAAGVRPGDVVITVPNTFIATTEAISQAGALPEFVDVDERTSSIDAVRLRHYLEQECSRTPGSNRVISKRSNRQVTALVPVHLYGQMADMDPLMVLADEFGLLVVEDACQAHGARYFSRKDQEWKRAGTIGIAAAFSFYPGKNLGACGEAGAITTSNREIANISQRLRDHGQSRKYCHEIEGYNGRLDSIQAGILRVKLQHLEGWNSKRRQNATVYDRLLAAIPEITPPSEAEWAESVYHLYVVRTENRDELMKKLTARKIGTGIHYPIPLHLQPAYKHLGYKPGDFPVTEMLAAEILSLPMYPGLTVEQQELVVEAVGESLGLPAAAASPSIFAL